MGRLKGTIETGEALVVGRRRRLRDLVRRTISVLVVVVVGTVVWPTAALAASPAEIAVSFDTASIPLNATATLTFRIGNPNTASNLTGIGFTDPLPDGLVVVTGTTVDGDCGGTVSADNGPSLVKLSNGDLTARTVCEISVDVRGTTLGRKSNSVQVTSSAGTSTVATGSLEVVTPPMLSEHFGAGWFTPGGSTSLSFEIDNPNDIPLTGVGFSDTLPGGLLLTSPTELTGGCGGGGIAAAPGGTVIRLTGATLAPHGACALSVDITGTATGPRANVTDPVTSNEAGNGSGALGHVSIVAPGDRIFWTSFINSTIVSAADLAPGGGGGFIDPAGAGHTAIGIALDPATGTMFWADRDANRISFANLDGSGVSTLNTMGATVSAPEGLAIDPAAGKIYWANFTADKISFANLDGSGAGDLDISGATASGPQGLAVDPAAGRIYWANSFANKISYANLNGTGGGADLPTGAATVSRPDGVVIDPNARRIYWANSLANSISYADLGDSAAGDLPISGLAVTDPSGLAIDHSAGKIYWGNVGSFRIDVANLDGSDAHSVDTTGGFGAGGYVALLRVPSGTAAPVVSGGSSPGSVLSCSSGTWASDVPGSFLYRAPRSSDYQWSVDGADIAGATSATYTALAPGMYRCWVTASNAAGATAQASAPHSVAATIGTVTPRATAPRVWALHETNSVFAVAGTPTPLTATTATQRHKRGTVFSFRLDQAATVAIVIERLQVGRLIGRSCVPDRHSLRGKRRCLRAATVATLRRNARSELNRVAFSGRIGRRTLKPGRYDAVFTAADGAGSSPAEKLAFTIVKR